MCKKLNSFIFILLFSCFSSFSFAGDIVHTIQKGDTIYSLSKKYKVSVDDILARNKITDASKIWAGQKIYIPTTTTNAEIQSYTVSKGDTLYGIAKKFGIKASDLMSVNGLTKDSIIKIGQKIKIPAQDQAIAKNTPKKEETNTKTINLKPVTDVRQYSSKQGNTELLWPIKAKKVSYLSGKIYGVAIEGTSNEQVTAIASGKVVSLGPYQGYGKVVFIQTKSKHIYVYGGLGDITVKLGETVSVGSQIGLLSDGNILKSPQLYFIVYEKNKAIDPAKAPRGF